MYQAIIFDLDGTLRESDPHFMDALRQCLLDLDISIDSFQWRLTERWVHEYWAQSTELLKDVEQFGHQSIWTRFIYRLMEHVGHPPALDEAEAFGQYVRDHFQPRSALTPGAIETLDALKATDVTLGLLSNRMHAFTDELEELGIAHYFDFTLAAGEIGVWKPKPGIFLEGLLRAGGVAPEAALYIGDNYYADIVGAHNAGIDAVLIDRRRVFTDVRGPRFESLVEMLAFLDENIKRE
jgi:HAD superfamily hydrolase (TIGR01549 family)